MRTYLIDESGNEVIVSLDKTIRHRDNLVEFHFCLVEEGKRKSFEKLFIRSLAGRFFASNDQVCWKQIPKQDLPQKILNVDKVFSVYRGYRPSGLGSNAAGDLVTQMPGKITKIKVKEGQKVQAGETLIILEAMKMENEVRSGIDGTIKKIHVQEGQALEQGVLMMEVEASE